MKVVVGSRTYDIVVRRATHYGYTADIDGDFLCGDKGGVSIFATRQYALDEAKRRIEQHDAEEARRHMSIYCCACGVDVEARLTEGSEIYPHRHDLFELPFWKCDTCGNHVGCHHKTSEPTRPLGVIPSPEIKRARQHIHALIDPLWKRGALSRKDVYARLTKVLGREYHTADLRTIEEARAVYKAAQQLANTEAR